jgi:hypothetical protein
VVVFYGYLGSFWYKEVIGRHAEFMITVGEYVGFYLVRVELQYLKFSNIGVLLIVIFMLYNCGLMF